GQEPFSTDTATDRRKPDRTIDTAQPRTDIDLFPEAQAFPAPEEDPHFHQTQEQVYAITQERLATMNVAAEANQGRYDEAYAEYLSAPDDAARAIALGEMIEASSTYTETVTN